MHDPRESHVAALKRLRYVHGTVDLGLVLDSSSPAELVVYTDADWAGCSDTRRSTSGYAVFLGGNLVSWSSKRQPVAEAEFRAVANNVAEVFWLRQPLAERHSQSPRPHSSTATTSTPCTSHQPDSASTDEARGD
jgi:hypothetical protein